MTTERPEKQIEVVRYRAGEHGYRDVSSYDSVRYSGPANEYKQGVMASAYRRLLGSLQGKHLLDVGCGTGRGVVEFGRTARLAVGSDASPDMLAAANRKLVDGHRCRFVAAYAQQLPFEDSAFDVVTSLNFLHLFSLTTQRDMIGEMKRVVKPGGIVLLEFDNALNGLGLGLYKRWKGVERGSLPQEIRFVIGEGCRVVRIYGAVFPVVWRVFCRVPRVFEHVEKIAYLPVLNRLSHRLYYKLEKL